MDPITTSGLPLGFRAPAPAERGMPGLPKPSAGAELPQPVQAEAQVNVEEVERKRFEAVKAAAQQIANVFVISDQRFTIFKDTSGQYVTRFTSLRDGKVTYIPEPAMMDFMRRATSADQAPLLDLQA